MTGQHRSPDAPGGDQSDPMGVAGFVSGLIGLLMSWLVPVGGIVLGALGIILGGVGVSRGRQAGRAMARPIAAARAASRSAPSIGCTR